jgi:hypothetical protein
MKKGLFLVGALLFTSISFAAYSDAIICSCSYVYKSDSLARLLCYDEADKYMSEGHTEAEAVKKICSLRNEFGQKVNTKLCLKASEKPRNRCN